MSNLQEIKTDLTIEQQDNISKSFEVQELEVEQYLNAYQHIIKQELSPQLAKQARELRLALVKEKGGVNKTHKAQKSYFLNGGRFVDSLKNVLVDKLDNMMSRLKDIEQYEQKLLQAQQEKAQAERSLLISKFTDNIPGNLGEMEQDMFDAILIGYKQKFELDTKKAKEVEANEKRIQQADKLYNDRRFKLQSYSHLTDVSALNLSVETTEKEYDSLVSVLEEKKKLFKEEADKKAKVAKQQAIELANEQKEKSELQAKLKAQEQIEKDARVAKRREELKLDEQSKEPVKKQLQRWLSELIIENPPVDNSTTKDIEKKFNGFKKWAESQIDKM